MPRVVDDSDDEFVLPNEGSRTENEQVKHSLFNGMRAAFNYDLPKAQAKILALHKGDKPWPDETDPRDLSQPGSPDSLAKRETPPLEAYDNQTLHRKSSDNISPPSRKRRKIDSEYDANTRDIGVFEKEYGTPMDDQSGLDLDGPASTRGHRSSIARLAPCVVKARPFMEDSKESAEGKWPATRSVESTRAEKITEAKARISATDTLNPVVILDSRCFDRTSEDEFKPDILDKYQNRGSCPQGSNSNELAIDLQRERHLPRPTRSTSHRVFEDLEAKDPKSVSRKSARRRCKTTGSINEKSSTNSRSIGHSSARARKILLEIDGNYDVATAALLNDQCQNTIPQNHQREVDTCELTADCPIDGTQGRPSLRTEARQQDKSFDQSANTPSQVRTDSDENQPHPEQINRQTDCVGASHETKQRKRGRPRKNRTHEMGHEHPNTEHISGEELSTGISAGHGTDLDPVTAKLGDGCEDPQILHETEQCGSAVQLLAAKPGMPAKVEADVKAFSMQEPSNSPQKASLLKNGKVPHRVGLSKRARIESLLKTVKKA